MSIREAINSNPRVTGGITAGVVGVVLLLVLWRGCSAAQRAADSPQRKVYFTTDDGKTYFEDSVSRIPPFVHNGKTAYRVRVVQCGTGQPYVLYLEKYPEHAKLRLEERFKNPKAAGAVADFMSGPGEPVMVKKPLTGDKGWVALSNDTAKQYEAIVKATCPDGSVPRIVMPR